MNWYEFQDNKENVAKMVKESKKEDWKGQRLFFDDELDEVQRYKLDPYHVTIVKSKTKRGYSANIRVKHAVLGPVIWTHYLKFDENEEKQCDTTLKGWVTICREIMAKFVDEEIPTSVFIPTIRKAITDTGVRDDTIKTNIPHINFSYDLKPEADWRSTIYGPRYPKYKEESFDQTYGGKVGKQSD